MRHRVFTVLVIGLVLIGFATFAAAQTNTTLSNVAAFQTVDSSPAYGGNGRFAGDKAVDSSLYAFFNADANTDPEDNPLNYWKVDLGQARDVDHLTIYCRNNDYSVPRINGAALMAFGSDGTTKVADNWVITGFLQSTDPGGPIWEINVDNGGAGWSGVQHFQIGGKDPTDPGYPFSPGIWPRGNDHPRIQSMG